MDRLAFTVGMSDAIVIATIVSAGSTHVPEYAEDTTNSRVVKQWSVHVTRWLKGHASQSSQLTFGHNIFRIFPEALKSAVPGDNYLLFLELVNHTIARNARYVPADNWQYIVLGTPSSFEQGAHHMDTLSADNAAQQVTQIIEQQSPEALSRQADLIVFGVPDFDNPVVCAPYGTRGGCIPVKVKAVITGSDTSSTISVFSVIPFYKAFGLGAIMFLTHKPTGEYELISGPAAYVPIGMNGVDKTGRSLPTWRDLVTRARSRPEGGGR